VTALPGIRQFDLSNRVALVTGGSKGLGQAIAAGLASAGADILLISRHLDEAESAAKEIANQYGHRAIGMQADVAVPDDIRRVMQRAMDEWGKLHIVVNNAGINRRGPVEDLSLDDFRQVMEVNVTGPWLLCRAALPLLEKSGHGSIINVASSLGVVGLTHRTPYASSKGAVVQMTRTLGVELASRGIRCNAICPGPFLTPMNESIAEDAHTKQYIVGAVPLGRWGRLEEIQGAAIFLASDAASYVTGSLLMVDGGWTCQ